MKHILEIYFLENESWHIGILRYFNPAGAHESGLIGEDPNGIPNNLLPYISQVAVGKFDKLKIFGDDYKTHDGTGVRDYIHVVDLAKGHLMALEALRKKSQILTLNLGSGRGQSVIDMIKAFEKASSKKIPYEIVNRRPGDIPASYTDTTFCRKNFRLEAKVLTKIRFVKMLGVGNKIIHLAMSNKNYYLGKKYNLCVALLALLGKLNTQKFV